MQEMFKLSKIVQEDRETNSRVSPTSSLWLRSRSRWRIHLLWKDKVHQFLRIHISSQFVTVPASTINDLIFPFVPPFKRSQSLFPNEPNVIKENLTQKNISLKAHVLKTKCSSNSHKSRGQIWPGEYPVQPKCLTRER